MNPSFIHIHAEYAAKSLISKLTKEIDLRLYLDTETSGFDANDPDGIKILQLGFKLTGSNKLFIILIKGSLLYGSLRDAWVFLLQSTKQVVIHNAKFDLKFLAGIGCDITKIKVFDTMLAIKTLYNGLLKFGGAGLADITTGIFEVVLNKKYGAMPWSKPDLEPDMLEYAANDILSLYMIHQAWLEFEFNTLPDILKLCYLKFLWFEHICLPSITQMEINGIFVSTEALEATKEEIKPLVDQLEVEIINTLVEADRSFKNPRSPTQMVRALNMLGIDGLTSTSKDLLPDYLDHHPIIEKILTWKTNAKLIEFLESMRDCISPFTGRIHGSFNQVGTDSGRFSASQPNLQQLPRDTRIRRIFQPQHNDWVMVVADYSQLELVIAAEITQDPEMVYAYNNGLDIHKITASFVLDKPLDQITKDDRQLAKAINFGFIYGMGAKKFKIYAKLSYGVSVTFEESLDTRDKFMTKYNGIVIWHQDAGQVQRTCQIMPSFTLANRYRLNRHPAQTSGWRFSSYLNSQDQGTGGDIAKLAIYLLDKYIQKNFLGHLVKIVSCVHDEVIIEAHSSVAQLISEKLTQAMVIAGQVWIKSVPVTAESGIGKNWSDAKP